MVIGIDASRANQKQKTGIGWYSYYLIQELKKIPLNQGDKFILYSSDKLKHDLATLPENWRSKILHWPVKYLWTQIRLATEMLFNPPDILFVPAHCLPIICPIKSVITIHDLGFKRFKKAYSLWQRIYLNLVYWWAARQANKIIVPSRFTKEEVLKFYKVKENRIEVVHEGYNEKVFYQEKDLEKINSVLQNYKIEKPYFLYVGRIESKKNIIALINAYKKLIKQKKLNVPKMVLIGRSGFGYVKIKKELELVKKMFFLPGYVKEEDLVYFYNGAVAFIFPSLYEGFGLPLLEAMACGCPVISSKSSCLPEIGKSAVLYFYPQDINDLARIMEKVIRDENIVNQLRQKGFINVKDFSWEKCAFETYKIFQAIK